jgi:putative ABC transport system permease protein
MMLTLLAIAAVIAVVIGVVGMIDTFIRTVDVGEEELLGTSPDRVVIDLDAILPIASPKLSAVLEASTISGAEPGLSVGGVLGRDDTEIEVFLHLIDLEGGLWRPTVTDGALDPGTPGVYIARKAARDLDVGVGDTIVVRHPQRQGPFAFTLEETELPVLGVHPDPFRFNTYLDLRHAGLMGLEGTANVVYAEPEPGATVAAVKRELFGLPGVTSVQRVAAGAQVMQELMGQFMAILRVVEVAILGLAMLIAFNSASIKMDERAREHATMFAFGVPVHTVMRTAVVESLAIGLMATAVGLAGGYVFLRWIVEVVLARTMPELGALTVISPASLALMGGLGVLAVAAAPLLTVRKLRRMDIPSTLRVME